MINLKMSRTAVNALVLQLGQVFSHNIFYNLHKGSIIGPRRTRRLVRRDVDLESMLCREEHRESYPRVLGECGVTTQGKPRLEDWGVSAELKGDLFYVGSDKLPEKFIGCTEGHKCGDVCTTSLHVRMVHAQSLILWRGVAP